MSTAKQGRAMSLPQHGQGRAESAPVKKRNATADKHLLNHSSSLHCPVDCQVEPRLHAHGGTVRHHSAGNTGTSGRQSSEKAHSTPAKKRQLL